MGERPTKPSSEFIHACKETRAQLDKWIGYSDKAYLKAHFSRLAKIINHLDCAIKEAEEI